MGFGRELGLLVEIFLEYAEEVRFCYRRLILWEYLEVELLELRQCLDLVQLMNLIHECDRKLF